MPSVGIEDPADQRFMREALALAGRAAAAGEVPVAAVIVERDEIVAQAYNRREMWQDPTAHAEMIAIREAATRRGTWRLTGLTLYVTLEPCTMCIGAIIQSRLLRVVFGAWDPKAGACGSLLNVPPIPRLNHSVQVTGGVAEQESQALLQSFFRTLRTECMPLKGETRVSQKPHAEPFIGWSKRLSSEAAASEETKRTPSGMSSL